MYTINDDNIIYLTRGDTLVVQVSIKEGDVDYVPSFGDVICFALKRDIMDAKKERYLDEEPLITKIIPNESLTLRIEAEDTKGLPFGRYAYEIELTKEDGFVDTFLSGKLYLTSEVK